MHDTLGDHYNVSRHEVIDLVLNKVNTTAFCDEIYLKMCVAVLAHGPFAYRLYFIVSVKVEFLYFTVHISKIPCIFIDSAHFNIKYQKNQEKMLN